MILVTGGLGFIGSHTVRALVDAGERCVLLQRRPRPVPADLPADQVLVEQADVTDLDSLLAVGARHEITGIVHLAGSMPWPPNADDPVRETRTALRGLLNIAQVGRDWAVRRIGIASTIGVYDLSLEGPLAEDLPLPMTADHLIPTFKKVGELLGGYLADAADLDIVNYRISGTWGPRGHDDPFFPAPQLVLAAARGGAPDLTTLQTQPYAEDALDLCYVKDTGRGIALLQLAERLEHRTYNVGSGRATSNAEVSAAIRAAVPDAQVDLPAGGSGRRTWLDITRIHADTGYQPAYDTERAAADYIAWLRAGNER